MKTDEFNKQELGLLRWVVGRVPISTEDPESVEKAIMFREIIKKLDAGLEADDNTKVENARA